MKIGIIVGSIRKGRITVNLAKWVEKETKQSADLEVTMIDLVDYPMPLFDELTSPQYTENRKESGKIAEFLSVLDQQDGVIVVTPEYNRSYPSGLKNALDYIAFELHRKPVMLVGHGSTGGSQAVNHLRAVFSGLVTITSPVAVMINGRVGEMFDETGEPVSPESLPPMVADSFKRGLDEFVWLTKATTEARKKEA